MELDDHADGKNPVNGKDTGLPKNSDLEVIRRILFDLELHELAQIKKLLDSPDEFADAVSKVLPEAVTMSTAQKDSLAKSMAPLIEKSLHLSISDNPEPLADALFPIMGPAIRKSINDTLRRMIRSINQTIEHSFSFRAVKWRIQSLITGKPYAEILLLNSLVYKVTDMFLIHKQTGLLIQHASISDEEALEDNDMISAMMTAIQDFVKDSFRLEESENLGAIQVGDLNLFVETGPHVILAAVVEGEAPVTQREKMTDFLENFHRAFVKELTNFNGDVSPYETVYQELQQLCDVKEKKEKKKTKSIAALLLFIIIILVAGFFIIRSVDQRNRWRKLISNIEKEPGIVLTDHGKRNGTYYVSGLKDPLAADPAKQIFLFGFDPEKVNFHWESYISITEPLMTQRISNLLNPPPEVKLLFINDTLFVSGEAPHQWITAARTQLKGFAGLNFISMDQLVDLDQVQFSRLADEIMKIQINFGMGQTIIPMNEKEKTDLIYQKLSELINLAAITKFDPSVLIRGESDSKGSETQNRQISLARAENLKTELVNRGMPENIFTTQGSGSSIISGDPRQNQRCVYLVIGE